MTEWRFAGERPPITLEDWRQEFAKYRASPEFKKVNMSMTLEEFKFILGTFLEAKVPFTINTDGTYLCSTSLQREFRLMTESGILTSQEAEKVRQRAFDASFIH